MKYIIKLNKEYRKKYYLENREKMIEYSKNYYYTNKCKNRKPKNKYKNKIEIIQSLTLKFD
jgi:hypothetical protein